jgi:hypothetical protein
MPKPNGKPGKLGTGSVRTDNAARAFGMSLKGMSNAAIGAEFGVSGEAIRLLLNEYRSHLVTPLAEEARNVELAKLDRAEAVAWRILEDNHVAFQHGKVVTLDGKPIQDVEPVFKAIATILKISERRSKYMGLDAPTKTETITTQAPSIDDHVMRLVEQVNANAEAERDALSRD